MSDWIDIRDRLPLAWQNVDVYLIPLYERFTDITFDGEEFVMATGSKQVTHWQPITVPNSVTPPAQNED